MLVIWQTSRDRATGSSFQGGRFRVEKVVEEQGSGSVRIPVWALEGYWVSGGEEFGSRSACSVSAGFMGNGGVLGSGNRLPFGGVWSRDRGEKASM